MFLVSKKSRSNNQENESNSHFFHEQYNLIISEMAQLIDEKIAKERFEIERKNAVLIQRILNNHTSTCLPELKIFGKILSADECSGDWWYSYEKDGFLHLWIGDVTGHGVSAAIVASACRATIMQYEYRAQDTELSTQANELNSVIAKMFEKASYVTFCAIKICIESLECEIVNGSHTEVFIKDEESTIIGDFSINPPLGRKTDTQYLSDSFQLSKKFQLFLTTDGFSELTTLPGKRWSQIAILKFFGKISREDDAEQIIHNMEEKIESIRETSRGYEDDITMVVVENSSIANSIDESKKAS